MRADVSHSSPAFDPAFDRELEAPDTIRAVFFGLGSDGTVSANKATIKIIGEQTALYAQGHFEYHSRKAGSTTVSHLRFGPRPIRATYRISQAQFVAVHAPEFLDRRDVLACAAAGATVLLNTAVPADRLWASLPREAQQQLVDRRCRLFAIDGQAQSERAGLGRRIKTVMQLCCFSLSPVLPMDEALQHLRQSPENTWSRRGPEVLRRNMAAQEGTLAALAEVQVPTQASSLRTRIPAVPADAPAFDWRRAVHRGLPRQGPPRQAADGAPEALALRDAASSPRPRRWARRQSSPRRARPCARRSWASWPWARSVGGSRMPIRP